jgi:hypothetical protein
VLAAVFTRSNGLGTTLRPALAAESVSFGL